MKASVGSDAAVNDLEMFHVLLKVKFRQVILYSYILLGVFFNRYLL